MKKTRRAGKKAVSDCSQWKRKLSGVSPKRIAGTVGFAAMTVLSLFRMSDKGMQAPKLRSGRTLSKWRPGYLDIHHLQVGSSVSTFVIMPDATVMLIDAGDVNVPYSLSLLKDKGPPWDDLKFKAPHPNDTKTPVGWIIDYMKDFWPSQRSDGVGLDYLLLTHFHSDHFGDGSFDLGQRPKSDSGNYVLTGIPELASKVPVRRIIDRGYPNYDVPVDMRSLQDKSFDNYYQFVQENRQNIHFEQFQVGSSDQITMLRSKSSPADFRIRVIKSGQKVAAPLDTTGPKDEPVPILEIPGAEALKDNLHGSENTMSGAIVIEYGDFRYYEGADQEVIRNENGEVLFDTIGPTAKAAGKVDVATLNHHGHGISQDYLNYMDPNVMILQGWSSDQPPNDKMEMLSAASSQTGNAKSLFATDIFQERLDDMGPALSKLFQSKSGHVVVRVHPPDGEARQTFEIVVLDGQRQIKQHYRNFRVRQSKER